MLLAVAVLIVFLLRLINWQILNGNYYLEKANAGTTYSVKLEGKRGEILDVNGVDLAINETGYKIVFDKIYMIKGTENEIILKLISLMESKNQKWIDELPITLNSDGTFDFIDDKEEETSSLKHTLKLNNYATPQNCMDAMVEKYDCSNYTKDQQRKICSVRYNMTKSGYDDSMTSPYTFADGLSSDIVSIVSEMSQTLKGIDIRTSSIRKYVNGTVVPHIVGNVGKLTKEEYDELKDTYELDDIIGKSGIESAMEDYLKGQDGKKIIEATSEGAVVNEMATKNAEAGDTIYLTIDSNLQKVVNKSLETNIKSARSIAGDCRSGAAVVLNIKDFSVLAASTYPSYDLAKYVENNDYYNDLVTDEKTTPLVNRAFNGAFTPGSIYKPIVACAALENNSINENSTIYCSGAYTYYSDSGFVIRCMGVHGSLTVRNALAKSCNVFFSETGRLLGIDNLDRYAKKFGLGQKTGVEVYESSGVLAGPEHSKSIGAVWYDGNTSQAAIGQSDNMFTPLQLATYTATIANGGNRYKTHVVSKITDYTRKNVIMQNDPDNPELVENVGVSEKNLNIVKQGMRSVVTSGTAARFSSYPVAIAAKTGTAETTGSDHTTFVCFAPYDKPEIAIAVVLEHGAKGVYSMNVAKDILDAYFYHKGIE